MYAHYVSNTDFALLANIAKVTHDNSSYYLNKWCPKKAALVYHSQWNIQIHGPLWWSRNHLVPFECPSHFFRHSFCLSFPPPFRIKSDDADVELNWSWCCDIQCGRFWRLARTDYRLVCKPKYPITKSRRVVSSFKMFALYSSDIHVSLQLWKGKCKNHSTLLWPN